MLFWAINLALPPQFVVVVPPNFTAEPVQHVAAPAAEAATAVPTNETTAAAPIASAAAAPTAPAPAIVDARPSFSWQAGLMGLWLAVIGLHLARLALQRIQLHRLLASGRPADADLLRLVARAGSELNLARVPAVRVTDADVSPFVCRIWRPILVLPTAIAAETAAPHLHQIVLHELAHVRRRDLAWSLVMHAVRTVYWFHPLAHWIAFREALERELACDQLVLTLSGVTVADYARTLIDAASRVAQPMVLRAAAAAHLDGGHPPDRGRGFSARPPQETNP